MAADDRRAASVHASIYPIGGERCTRHTLRVSPPVEGQADESQIGCGQTTRLVGEEYNDLWVEQTFLEEMEAIYKHLKVEKGEHQLLPVSKLTFSDLGRVSLGSARASEFS